jgi:hypothetical protein
MYRRFAPAIKRVNTIRLRTTAEKVARGSAVQPPAVRSSRVKLLSCIFIEEPGQYIKRLFEDGRTTVERRSLGVPQCPRGRGILPRYVQVTLHVTAQIAHEDHFKDGRMLLFSDSTRSAGYSTSIR